MAHTEFFCDPVSGSASNLNGGSGNPDTESAPALTSTGGSWDGTSVFSCTGSPTLTGALVGKFASVAADASSPPTGYIARVNSVDNIAKTITLDTTALSGTAPLSGGSITIRVGGAWKGPNGTENFPVNFLIAAARNVAGDTPRVNLRNNGTYSVTASISRAVAGCVFQGYQSGPGDEGKATIDAVGVVGSSINILSISGVNTEFADLIVQNNGDTGTNAGILISGSGARLERVRTKNSRGSGIQVTAAAALLSECEASAWGLGGAVPGIRQSAAGNPHFERCNAHDGTGDGFGLAITAHATLDRCLADTATGNGVNVTSATNAMLVLKHCDIYAPGAAGVAMPASSGASAVIENCNIVNSGTAGVSWPSPSASSQLRLINCGFFGNGGGNLSISTAALVETGTINYAANPFADPAAGDFTPLLPARGVARSRVPQADGYTKTTASTLDLGAFQSFS